MDTESRQTIHVGINFVFSPIPTIDPQSNLRFQQSLLSCGIEFSHNEIKEQEIIIVRERSPRLEIKVAAISGSPVGQIIIVSPDPRCELNLFGKDVEAILQAFDSTWPGPNRQIISSDVTLRDLYETAGEHAFKELWEKRLGQPTDSLARLGRPVLGGGLRFVMPAQSSDPDPVQVEVKIESFLRNTNKIFVETQFVWPSPKAPGTPFEPKRRLEEVDRYVEDKVEAFIVGGQ